MYCPRVIDQTGAIETVNEGQYSKENSFAKHLKQAAEAQLAGQH